MATAQKKEQKRKNLSVKKRLRQNKKAYLKNRIIKSKFKTAGKNLLASIMGNNVEEASKQLKFIYKYLDKGIKKSTFHKKFVGRNKSKWQNRYNQFLKKIEEKKASNLS